jgi:hypothetical protein
MLRGCPQGEQAKRDRPSECRRRDGGEHRPETDERRSSMNVSPVDVQKHLRGVSYPATREELVLAAENRGAPEEVVETLQALAAEVFEGPENVMEELES